MRRDRKLDVNDLGTALERAGLIGLGALGRAPAANAVVLKLSYWFG